jgi:hypothetical protein
METENEVELQTDGNLRRECLRQKMMHTPATVCAECDALLSAV